MEKDSANLNAIVGLLIRANGGGNLRRWTWTGSSCVNRWEEFINRRMNSLERHAFNAHSDSKFRFARANVIHDAAGIFSSSSNP